MSTNTATITAEISKLLFLAHDKSTNGKTMLFDEITQLFEKEHESFNSDQRFLMTGILEQLILSVEIEFRQKLALKLAQMDNIPAELIILLANDEIDVARPVIDLSQLLKDDDLIKIIRHKSAQHQLSIAGRKYITSNVCRHLIATGNDDVIVTLLSNNDASIDNVSLEKLVETSRLKTRYQPPIVRRPDLSKELAARMYGWVSKNLKSTLANTHGLTAKDINDSLKSVISSLQKDYQNQSGLSSEEQLINKLHTAQKLQPSFLMKSLNQGQAKLFELAFAKLINISHEKMCSILYDRGEKSLAVACAAVNIDRGVFLTIFRLTRIARGMDSDVNKETLKEVFELFQNLDARKAQLRIHKWLADDARVPIF